MMIHIKQPSNSRTCGHHCIAMICGVPVQDVIDYLGHSHGTKYPEFVKALRHFGKQTADTFIPYKSRHYMTKVCIMVVNWKGKGSHAVVYNDGLLYDPGYDGVVEFDNKHYMYRGEIITHLNIW